MSKIEITDTAQDIIVKMVSGNPGAIGCLVDIIKHSKDIDPQDVLVFIGLILMLDTLEIYGSQIYVLWSDKCGRDTRKMVMLLRSVQLGLLPSSKIKQLAEDSLGKVNLTPEEFDALDSKVCERLKEFQRPGVKDT